MSCLIIQKKLTYLLELNYSTKCFNQAGWDFLATTPYYKKQSLVRLLPNESHLSHSMIHMHISATSSQEGKKTCYVYHIIPAARTQAPQQELKSSVGRGARHSNGTQQHNWWVPHGQSLPLLWCDACDTKPNEDICRQQSPSFTKKPLQQYGDICHLNPILLISFQEELSLQHFHTME